MIAPLQTEAVRHVDTVSYVTADEAYHLLDIQLQRFLALVETLGPDDWSRPTACTKWSVKDILAHQAGGYATGTGYREMFRQYTARPKPGELPEDAVNDLQVRERQHKTPAELIDELQRVGPVGVRKWAYQFRIAKWITIPHPVPGWLSLRHLMWVIHSRDTWMHRLDICRAIGRPFEQTAGEDGRIVALVMFDAARAARKSLAGQSIRFDLTGIAGGTYQLGHGQPAATVQMDVLDFNIFVSGRYTYEQTLPLATITGDTAIAHRVLKNLLVLY